ncbi:MAG: FecR domain-containing protein [Colwellia sp.]|nr:FecR domain-containing protein [Colwellia sp.]
MTKVTQFSSKEEIQEQACLWISRIDRGCTKSEKKEIALWINQSNAHREILMKMASLWDDLSVLNELSALFPLENATKRTRHHFRKIAVAASVIFVALLGGSLTTDFQIFPSLNQNQNVVQKFSTKVGKQAIFSLSDGTSIQLNTNSMIEVVYSERQRYVKLLQGEAKFDVAKDSTRPFTVNAGEKSFTALGTIFNVQKDTNKDLELLVTEGKVLISTSDEFIEYVTHQTGSITLVNLPGVLVNSGEKAVINDNVLRPINKVTLVQVQRDLAWQQGMLIFEGEPLGKALKEISRYSNTHFEIMDDELSQLVIAGYFKADDIDGLLKSLSLNFNIHHQRTSSDLIRLSSERM